MKELKQEDLPPGCLWTLLEEAPKDARGNRRSRCKCVCGCAKIVYRQSLLRGASKNCGCVRRQRLRETIGTKHPNWKGGCRVNSSGYVEILIPGHPLSSRDGYVLEHVLVMSTYVGRLIRKPETVHHRNGVRDDNRLENLELWSSSHPPGQRIEDKIAWAHEVLTLYCKVEDDGLVGNWWPPETCDSSLTGTAGLAV